MPKKIQNFARSALVKPITVNVGRAGAASLDVMQEVEYVKQEAKIVYILECLQKTPPPVSTVFDLISALLIVFQNSIHSYENSVDQDQLASNEASWSGSTLSFI